MDGAVSNQHFVFVSSSCIHSANYKPNLHLKTIYLLQFFIFSNSPTYKVSFYKNNHSDLQVFKKVVNVNLVLETLHDTFEKLRTVFLIVVNR